MDPGLAALRHHGDAEVADGMLDFAVNVQGTAPPQWLRRRLAAQLDRLGSYPSASAERAARAQVAARHGRSVDEVMLLGGAAEGFALLPKLRPAHAVVCHPSFTEPELALREADVPTSRVIASPPFELDPSAVPESVDLVVLGNPTNPTSVLHRAEEILRLRRPGRLLVVDEAFADAVPGEPESLAGRSLPDVLVLRSLTKTWALAGLRCGYLLGPAAVLDRLRRGRPHWPLGTLQLEAIRACSEPAAVRESFEAAHRIAAQRSAQIDLLTAAGARVHQPAAAPFLLLHVPHADVVRKKLREKGIAVRRADTFPGLDHEWLRVAVREEPLAAQLADALADALR